MIKSTKKMSTSSLNTLYFWAKNWMTSWRRSHKICEKFSEVSVDLWPGDSMQARSYIQGRFEFGQEVLNLNEFTKHLIVPDIKNSKTLLEIHSFEWLRDFRCISDSASRRLSRQLIQDWITAHDHMVKKKTSGPLFEANVIGYRLYNWISLFDFYASSATDAFREMVILSLYNQMHHLQFQLKKTKDPIQKFIALKGFLFAQAAFQVERQKIERTVALLKTTIDRQVLDDGSHFTRDPQIQLIILRDLIDMRALLKTLDIDVMFLNHVIGIMTPIVRLFRHGDGGLADFCTSRLIQQFPLRKKPSQALIDMVLTLSDVKGKTPGRLTEMGYERVVAHQSLLIQNTKPVIDVETRFFGPGLGVLNFEWSNGRTRYIEKSDFVVQNAANHWVTFPVHKDAAIVRSVDRQTEDGHTLLEGRIEGVTEQKNTDGKKIAANYSRSIYLNSEGTNIRGSEKIYITSDAIGALRFVFAPHIEITPTQGANSIGAIIKIPIPDQMRRGSTRARGTQRFQLCRFVSNGAHDISIQHDERTNTNAMILITKIKSDHTCDIKWAFHLQSEKNA